MQADIAGTVAPGFEPVKEVFASLWQDVEVGAGFCAYVEGKPVVDLWGGWTDREFTQPWQEDTLINIYSTTKGPAALAMAMLHDDGLLDYDAPVTHYWPEFGQSGKDKVTVAQLLSHQGGVCGVDKPLTVPDLYDFDAMVALIAAQSPLWKPGTGAGYHAVTWGYLPGELMRHITGKTLGSFLRERVTEPLDADFHLGVQDEDLSRCAPLIGPNHARRQTEPGTPSATVGPLYEIALTNPSISPFRDASSTAWRQAEIAASNGHATARGIARIYTALAEGGELDGVRIISPEAINAATQPEVEAWTDKVQGTVVRRSRGFILNSGDEYGPGTSPNTFGHAGAGGSTGFADPDHRIAVGYVMNQMWPGGNATPRSQRLIKALYECLR